MNNDQLKDDQDWSNLLAGHDVPDANPETKRDAAMWRDVILKDYEDQSRQEDSDISDADVEQHWQQMRFRLRREGLLPGGVKPKPWWQKGPALMAMAATLAGVVIIPQLIPPSPPGIPNGTPKGFSLPIFKQVENPRQSAEQLATVLKQANVKAEVAQDEDMWFVIADIEAPTDALIKALADLAIELPEDGKLRVQFSKSK
ncbi:MAG: hypothetical protein KDJ99_20475 [Candidatus Competibacteraceae bacterium]|nr:hypothetical protein [Candidatus Competibacteraceae bacterium]